MPSTYPERRARWPEGDTQAAEFLESKGYNQEPDFSWSHPDKNKVETLKEIDAILYLIEEWDWGFLRGGRREVNMLPDDPRWTEDE